MAETTNSYGVSAGRFELWVEDGVDLSLNSLAGVGAKTRDRLISRGIHDLADLLLFFPRAYRRTYAGFSGPDLARMRAEYAEIQGTIQHVRRPPPRGRAPLEVTVDCDGERFRLFWFNMHQRWFLAQFEVGASITAEGKIEWDRGYGRMAHPNVTVGQYEPLAPSVKLEPIYPQMEGVRSATVVNGIKAAASTILPRLRQVLPVALEQTFAVPTVEQAIRQIHLLTPPIDDWEESIRLVRSSRDRLVFEEFYTLQLELAEQYARGRRTARAPRLDVLELGRDLVRELPFKLTDGQKKASATIAGDLASPVPMRRLLQGDVGSGKTVVAFGAAAIAVGSGGQVALLAPTEVLARQHFAKARELLSGISVNMGFLSGSSTAAQRRDTLERLSSGEIHFLIGTHAIFQDDVEFAPNGLALVIVDEQHKFGVEQRDRLMAKGQDPHLLVMTATPIPRSLAHACFGDLDLSVIREKPPGRKPIRTVLRTVAARERLYTYVRGRIEGGEQAFVVFPLIDASEAVSHRANVLDRAEELANGALKGLAVGVLHGRMSSQDKAAVMGRFRAGEIRVLCATTVIEVGVDVPQATLMVIESAEVFGLSQLHQLRGRVGRSDLDSMCVVLASHGASPEAIERLKAFESTEDGFKLAEIDLTMRGAGQFLGLRQAGRSEFRFGDILRDGPLLERAREAARTRVLGDAGR